MLQSSGDIQADSEIVGPELNTVTSSPFKRGLMSSVKSQSAVINRHAHDHIISPHHHP